MSQVAATLPEPKYRSTQKRALHVRSTMPSEHQHPSRHAQTMSPAVELVQDAPKKAKKAEMKITDHLAGWWPVFVGLFLSGFAPEWHSMAVQAGVWAERFTFPLTLLAAHRESGLDDQMTTMLPQIALYLQLPLEGLLTMLTLARGKSLMVACLQLVSIHAVCTLVLWLLSLAPS